MPESPRPSLTVRRWALGLYWAGIYTLTHWPGISRWQPPLDWPDFDKIVHFFFYAGWAALWCWLLVGSERRLSAATLGWLTAGGAAYAIFDELTQAIVGRKPDLADFVLDMLGVLAVVAAAKIWQTRRARTSAAA